MLSDAIALALHSGMLTVAHAEVQNHPKGSAQVFAIGQNALLVFLALLTILNLLALGTAEAAGIANSNTGGFTIDIPPSSRYLIPFAVTVGNVSLAVSLPLWAWVVAAGLSQSKELWASLDDYLLEHTATYGIRLAIFTDQSSTRLTRFTGESKYHRSFTRSPPGCRKSPISILKVKLRKGSYTRAVGVSIIC